MKKRSDRERRAMFARMQKGKGGKPKGWVVKAGSRPEAEIEGEAVIRTAAQDVKTPSAGSVKVVLYAIGQEIEGLKAPKLSPDEQSVKKMLKPVILREMKNRRLHPYAMRRVLYNVGENVDPYVSVEELLRDEK